MWRFSADLTLFYASQSHLRTVHIKYPTKKINLVGKRIWFQGKTIFLRRNIFYSYKDAKFSQQIKCSSCPALSSISLSSYLKIYLKEVCQHFMELSIIFSEILWSPLDVHVAFSHHHTANHQPFRVHYIHQPHMDLASRPCLGWSLRSVFAAVSICLGAPQSLDTASSFHLFPIL